MMCDPLEDFERLDREDAQWRRRRPSCCRCGEPIQEETLWNVDGDLYHEECARLYFCELTEKYLNENSILYVDPGKKRTDSWLSLNRLQLPLGESNYGSIRKITYADGKIKVQSHKNMTGVQKALFDAGVIDEFGNKLLSDRDTESVSNRSLLSNAFESVANNDIERQKIQEYKEKVALINAEERKLQELNAQIKELSFANGKRDTKKISDLRFEAQKAANRIDTYDRQLLRLEASQPLKDVLRWLLSVVFRGAGMLWKHTGKERRRSSWRPSSGIRSPGRGTWRTARRLLCGIRSVRPSVIWIRF